MASIGKTPMVDRPTPVMVELLSASPIDLDLDAIAARASERANARTEVATSLGIAFPDIRIQFADAELPFTVSLLGMGSPPHRGDDWIEGALQQTWAWDRDRAREAVRRVTDAVLVTDMMAGPLDHRFRLPAYQAVLAAAVEAVHPDALHWMKSECLVEPDAYLANVEKDPLAFESAVNVRFVTIEDEPGQALMDTVGLAPFLIPDVQMHFSTLEPGWVACKLLNVARYLFENGDVIEDGHSVSGRTDDEKWPCRHEDPLLGPPRVVLDIDPWPNGPRRD
jgi:hypothetical protein